MEREDCTWRDSAWGAGVWGQWDWGTDGGLDRLPVLSLPLLCHHTTLPPLLPSSYHFNALPPVGRWVGIDSVGWAVVVGWKNCLPHCCTFCPGGGEWPRRRAWWTGGLRLPPLVGLFEQAAAFLTWCPTLSCCLWCLKTEPRPLTTAPHTMGRRDSLPALPGTTQPYPSTPFLPPLLCITCLLHCSSCYLPCYLCLPAGLCLCSWFERLWYSLYLPYFSFREHMPSFLP